MNSTRSVARANERYTLRGVEILLRVGRTQSIHVRQSRSKSSSCHRRLMCLRPTLILSSHYSKGSAKSLQHSHLSKHFLSTGSSRSCSVRTWREFASVLTADEFIQPTHCTELQVVDLLLGILIYKTLSEIKQSVSSSPLAKKATSSSSVTTSRLKDV